MQSAITEAVGKLRAEVQWKHEKLKDKDESLSLEVRPVHCMFSCQL